MADEGHSEKNALETGCSRMEGRNDPETLDDMLEKLGKIQGNLMLFINNFPREFNQALDDDGVVDKLRSGVHELLDKFYAIVGPLVEVKISADKRIKQLETTCGEWMYHMKNKQKELDSAQQVIRELKSESAGHVAFCTHMGAILGTLMWKSSRSSPLVDLWLDQNRHTLDDFLSITNTALSSFLHTFDDNFPDIKDEQCQFMMSLLGTVSNISSISTGRSFMISLESGKELIKQIVLGIPTVPSISGDTLKRLMLMTIYNVSLHRVGLPYLLDLKVHELIAKCSDGSPEIQLNFLRVFQSITYDLKDMDIADRLLHLLPVIKIEQFKISSDERIADAAAGILANINKIYANADTISDKSTNN